MRTTFIAAALVTAVGGCSGSIGSEGMGEGGVAGTIGAVGGRGGAGLGGPAGSIGESCAPMTPSCPASLCGNGVVDTCRVYAGFGFCPEVMVTEICDGAVPATQTCQTSGFGSGMLACSAFCAIDTSGCSECLPTGGPLLSCGSAPVAAAPLVAAIAATDAGVALAWIDQNGPETPELRFALLSPSLDLLSTSRIDEPALAAVPINSYWYLDVSVAALPSGWAIAGYADPDLYLHAVDGSGQALARIRLDAAPIEDVFGYPRLAGRPDGGPLVVWQTASALRVAVVAADGRSTTTPLTLPVSGRLADPAQAVFAGGAFHVLAPIDRGSNSPQLRVFRISADGTLASTFDALPSVVAWQASLVPAADDLRIIYNDGQRFVWRKLNPAGAPLSGPVAIGSGIDFGGNARSVGFGADTVALLVGVNAANAIGITRVAGDGTIVSPAFKIATGPSVSLGWYDIARRGPDAVAFWLGGSGFHIARVTP